MLLQVTTITTLCLLFELSKSTNTEQELEEMFKARRNQSNHLQCEKWLKLIACMERCLYCLMKKVEKLLEVRNSKFCFSKQNCKFPHAKHMAPAIYWSGEDWENAWHNERHTRCQEMLLRHLYWACEKDIYRLSRRNEFQDLQNQFTLDRNNPRYPFLSVVEARVFLRDRRGQRRNSAEPSITDECCHNTAGCTWEEYAEYCPANKRLRKFV